MNDNDKIAIQDFCIEKKAKGSQYINTQSIVIANWTRFKCQYGCSAYNKSYCCPPYSPIPEETKKIIADYKIGLIVHFSGGVNVTETIIEIEKEIFLKNYYKVISFGAGPCKLCKNCSDAGCKFPHQARPSMEACGIDVYSTVRNNGFPINVLRSKDKEENRYGLILIE